MPFPKPGTDWPPTDYKVWYTKMVEWGAWYSGDPMELVRLYSSSLYHPNTEQGRFWARTEAEERVGVVHLPAAGDIASMSANLLFSETPEFKYEKDRPGGDRITDFIRENGVLSLLLEGSEIAAALSGVFLKLDIDPEVTKLPILSVVTPLQAIPYFRRGRLWEVLFFRVVKEENDRVWRLFELRKREDEQLVIQYKLYQGGSDKVGREVDIASIDETATLGLEDISYEIDGLGCVYVPNMRPNRLMPGSPLGINDYHGSITLLDSLDFAWTSWMRDIELGMAQILVDEELLEKPNAPGELLTQTGRQARARFNKLEKAFIKLNLSPWKLGGESGVKPIEQVQFELRVEEHMKTCESLLWQIVTQCGYSPQTFGLGISGRAESGTALRIRERKSLLTREKKSRYWQPTLAALFSQMQQLDLKSNLAPKHYDIQEVDVVLGDSIIPDPRENSEVIRNLDQAKAVSTYTKVVMLHPDWTKEDIEAEVQRILDDQGAGLAPFGAGIPTGTPEEEGTQR